MGTATQRWPHVETDHQRLELLAAADRLLVGKPTRSTGNLSVVQLAVEADVKYWVVAQKHTDLRDHFQRLVEEAKQTPFAAEQPTKPEDKLAGENAELRAHCAKLEQLVTVYATAVNELSIENRVLRAQASELGATITPLVKR
jgi:Txe/YoeB family toxin of Txe-Axe toxin-antitoxin module